MDINEAINAMALDHFRKNEYFEHIHGSAKSITIRLDETSGSCGCYSEYTRDDGLETYFIVTTEKGDFLMAISHRYMNDDLCNKIESYMEMPRIEDYCHYESEDTPWED